ncbi:MAG: MBL fold metallo-hydrolase [Eubacterium sp.]|nr:MBL fold metallo-hydrolase [Eubacterium sp.]
MKKALKIVLILIVIAAIITGGYFMIINSMVKNRFLSDRDFADINIKNEDAIYFLNTGSSDAIILQSNGHYAMIDAGEDNDNPRNLPALEFKGYEEEILEWLKKNIADENGNVHLDFVLGTHAHSDHIGGFDTIINDENVFVDKAYLKEYHSDSIRDYEIDEWDNQEVYDQMVEALNKKSVPIISEISSEPFAFGSFTLTMLNTGYEDGSRKVGENDNSLVVLVEKDGKKALLTGDLDNYNNDEEKIAEIVGTVDLLKVGHHSYNHSTEKNFLQTVYPAVSVITNSYEHTDKRTLKRITEYTKSRITCTDDEHGIGAIFKDGEIIYTHNVGL